MIDKREFITWLQQFPAAWLRPLCRGILNVTPDSFHDGGAYLHPADALHRLQQMLVAGVDLIDIGAMSSRPGHQPISAEEEWQRLAPVLRQAVQICSAPISVDTDKAEVAEAALKAGAAAINYCGGKQDTAIYHLAAEYGVPLIVMHRDGEEGGHAAIVNEVLAFFQASRRTALSVGVAEWQLVFDPGFGFAKNVAENVTLMRALPQLAAAGRPLLAGFSHKRFVAALSGERAGAAPYGNSALSAYCLLHGVHIIRVHEVEHFVPVARALRLLQEEN